MTSGVDLVALELTDATILQLQAGDMVVLKVRRRLTPEAKRQLRAHWEQAVKGTAAEDAKVAILDEETDIAILRSSDRT